MDQFPRKGRQLQDVFMSRLSTLAGDETNSLSPTELRQALTDANKLSLVQQKNREKMHRVIKTLPGGSVSNPILNSVQAMAFSRPSTAGTFTPGFDRYDWRSHVLDTFEKANLLNDGLSAGPVRITSAPSTDQVLTTTQRQPVLEPQKVSGPKKQQKPKDFSFGKPHKADDFVFGRITPLETVRHKRWERIEMERQAKLQKIALKATRRTELVRCRCMLEHVACARFGKVLYNALMKRRKAKERAVKFGTAQVRIARWYRSMVLMERFKVTVALAHIQSLAFGVKMHLRRRRIAIRRIRTFFAQTKRIHQIIFAKKKFCGAVRVLQRATRDYKMCTAARMRCLYMIWDIVAADYVRETNAASNEMSDQEESMLLLNVPSDTDLLANGATAVKESADVAKKSPGSLPLSSPSNISDAKARRLEWQRKRKDLQLVARGKLLRKQLQDFENTCNRAWHRIDGRIEKVRMKLVKSKVVPNFSSKMRYFSPRVALVPIEMRNSLLSDLLVRIRRSHQERWSGEANRIRYREASKKFSMSEARNILSLKNPRTPPLPVPPPDRRVKEWPVLAFFIPFEVSETCHVSDAKRLRDLVALVYRGAVDEVEGTGGLDSPRRSSIRGNRHRRHSLL